MEMDSSTRAARMTDDVSASEHAHTRGSQPIFGRRAVGTEIDATMPTYKLYYFNLKARAELTRWIFAQAGVEYEDIRVTKEQWAEMKPTTPNGCLPILDVDGKVLSGSGPI